MADARFYAFRNHVDGTRDCICLTCLRAVPSEMIAIGLSETVIEHTCSNADLQKRTNYTRVQTQWHLTIRYEEAKRLVRERATPKIDKLHL